MKKRLSLSVTAPKTYRLVAVSSFICLLGLLFALGLQSYVPVEYLMGDPAALSGQPLYFGALSNIGVLFWTASAVVCLFSAGLLKVMQVRSEAGQFLAAFGSLSAILGLDDLFLLHERVLPIIFRVSQSFILLGYAILLCLCLCRFRKVLLNHQPLVFGLSLCLFSVSVLVDVVPWQETSVLPLFPSLNISHHLLEDGAKLLAVFVWLAYFVWTAMILVIEAMDKALMFSTVEQAVQQHSESGHSAHIAP